MASLRIFSLHDTLLCTRTGIQSCWTVNWNFILKKYLNCESKVGRDVVLYTAKMGRKLYLLHGLAGLNCILWSYNGWDQIWNSVAVKPKGSSKFFNWLYETREKYRTFIGVLAIVFGVGFYATICLFTRRLVKCLTLHSGGRSITIETFKIPGFQSVLKIPTSQVSAQNTRKAAKYFLPLKVKNHSFFYILDMEGNFNNGTLFDSSAGMQRNF